MQEDTNQGTSLRSFLTVLSKFFSPLRSSSAIFTMQLYDLEGNFSLCSLLKSWSGRHPYI